MGRTKGRSGQQTRTLVIDAAREVFMRDGISASLDSIAEAAGVSKGGLFYHFSSKDELVIGVMEEIIEAFRTTVLDHVDPEGGAGKLTRAYVESSLSEAFLAPEAAQRGLVAAQLLALPAVTALVEADNLRWDTELAADGVEHATQEIVIAACDGVNASPVLGTTWSAERLAALKESLLSMVDSVLLEP